MMIKEGVETRMPSWFTAWMAGWSWKPTDRILRKSQQLVLDMMSLKCFEDAHSSCSVGAAQEGYAQKKVLSQGPDWKLAFNLSLHAARVMCFENTNANNV